MIWGSIYFLKQQIPRALQKKNLRGCTEACQLSGLRNLPDHEDMAEFKS